MKDKLDAILSLAREEIAQTTSQHDLNMLKSKFTGKKSELSGMLKQLGSLPKEEKPIVGQVINRIKKDLENILKEREAAIQELQYRKSLEESRIDITMPGRHRGRGALHPVKMATRLIEDVSMSLGFEVAEGYDIEDEYHNFDALNTPQDHPARELSDTFYIEGDVLLRTQTSTVQIRTMQSHKPPIRIISPGRCYRNDNDASHSPAFSQVEALVVDKGVTFVDLRDMLNMFVKRIFSEKISSRFRPHFFPFTEPSAEMDIVCVACEGKGCPLCKGTGWLEMGGAGMVDPDVLKMCDIDPEVYSGYAFGLGIERIAMLKYKIPDMRMLFENDLRFLRQFR